MIYYGAGPKLVCICLTANEKHLRSGSIRHLRKKRLCPL